MICLIYYYATDKATSVYLPTIPSSSSSTILFSSYRAFLFPAYLLLLLYFSAHPPPLSPPTRFSPSTMLSPPTASSIFSPPPSYLLRMLQNNQLISTISPPLHTQDPPTHLRHLISSSCSTLITSYPLSQPSTAYLIRLFILRLHNSFDHSTFAALS